MLLKAILSCADTLGRIKLEDIVGYFSSYYEDRKRRGLIAEKANSVIAKDTCTYKQAEHVVLIYPFKRFETMNMMHHTKTLGIVQVDESVWKALSAEEKAQIEEICNTKLEQYYNRLRRK